MSPEIMGAEMNPGQISCFLDHDSRRRVSNRKNSLFGLDSFFPDVIFQTICDFLGNKNDFLPSSAFGVP
jgi:hypothetical protein